MKSVVFVTGSAEKALQFSRLIYDGEDVTFFDSSLSGVVVSAPRGSGGFGFDRIFAPEGFGGRTAAELSAEEYDCYYSLVKPFNKVRRFLDG